MIIVDGRTDVEKLEELLATGTECTELEFKEILELGKNKRDELSLVLDIVSMANHYPGGYIIVGASDDGAPSERTECTDWEQFDGARLTDKVRRYVDAPLTVISSRHVIEGHTYCLICVQSHAEGLPVPFSKLGQYQDGDSKACIVFRPGEISRRDGAQNRTIEFSQWEEILARHDDRVRETASKQINDLVEKIIVALGEHGKMPPLLLDADDDVFYEALHSYFEQGEHTRLVNYIYSSSFQIGTDKKTLGRVVAMAVQAIIFRQDDVYNAAVEVLYGFYERLDLGSPSIIDTKMAIAIGIYEIGAALVSIRRWDLISTLVNRHGISGVPNYVYASWLRECQVEVSRSGKEPGWLISGALKDIRSHPKLLLPGIAPCSENASEGDGLTKTDSTVLDLLCSFDFLYCVCVFAVRDGHGGAYPSCSMYSEKRIGVIAAAVFGENDTPRHQLLPDKSDAQIARSVREVLDIAHKGASSPKQLTWGMYYERNLASFLDKADHFPRN